eukprot:6275221-Pyramimonas_sp.AAC.1
MAPSSRQRGRRGRRRWEGGEERGRGLGARAISDVLALLLFYVADFLIRSQTPRLAMNREVGPQMTETKATPQRTHGLCGTMFVPA